MIPSPNDLIPALNYAKRDVQRDHLTDEDQRMILEGMRETLLQTDGFLREAAARSIQPKELHDPRVRHEPAPRVIVPRRILGCPATDESDYAGLEMLRQILDPKHWDIELTALTTLTSELANRIVEDPPAILCIASLPPSGMAHARYLCKRVRDASPEIQIVVGRWGSHRNVKAERDRLEQAGATFVTTSLLETRQLLESRWHLLTRESPVAFESAMPESVADLELVVSVPNG